MSDDQVSGVLIEKICRLICKRHGDNPDSQVFRGNVATINDANALWAMMPPPHQLRPLWSIYTQTVRNTLEILQSGQFILPNHVSVEDKQYIDTPDTTQQAASNQQYGGSGNPGSAGNIQSGGGQPGGVGNIQISRTP